eukprot:TRINITY_DN19776_c0_g1_i2.p1 TRINITY_DN19776_c0_g1~~TRINITY_DN19776_c0_g1_i2.p1  ORF type:complete len:269 (-),score=67.51 TRINITY_DN19776_c0_g1_i2:116-892(-)
MASGDVQVACVRFANSSTREKLLALVHNRIWTTSKTCYGLPAQMEAEGPLHGYVMALVNAAHSAGEALQRRRHRSLGAFVLERLEAEPRSAEALVAALAEALPAFADTAVYVPRPTDDAQTRPGSIDVFFYKKAQVLVAELWRRFREEEPRLFDFQDLGALTVCADNVLPAVLLHMGAMTADAGVVEAIAAVRPLERSAEIALRAAAVAACELILEAANAAGGDLMAHELDSYLWGVVGKQDEFRKLQRHVCKDTIFY